VKREATRLNAKAVDALILVVEHFNRPWDQGRVCATLILLDHRFEMLLKAAILKLGGRIRNSGEANTIGFEACVKQGLSNGAVKFLDNDQAIALRTFNGLRDAAQHHLLEISETSSISRPRLESHYLATY
jgi:hypothetical protein